MSKYSDIITRAEAFQTACKAALDARNADAISALDAEATALRRNLIALDQSEGEEWTGTYPADTYWDAPRYTVINALQNGRGDLSRLADITEDGR